MLSKLLLNQTQFTSGLGTFLVNRLVGLLLLVVANFGRQKLVNCLLENDEVSVVELERIIELNVIKTQSNIEQVRSLECVTLRRMFMMYSERFATPLVLDSHAVFELTSLKAAMSKK